MSNEQHEVTVYDRVPATARVSAEQFESYLRRTGWAVRWSDEARGMYHWERNGDRLWTWRDEIMGGLVALLAEYEQRLPSAVLADIAREPQS